MQREQRSFGQRYTFVVRIWWEAGLTRPNGQPLWRGQIEHAMEGHQQGFSSLEELLRLIQEQTGDLEGGGGSPVRATDRSPQEKFQEGLQ